MRISLHHLGSLALFSQVVQLRSFTAAAKHFGLSKSAISRRISQLEAHYETQLLIRTPRGFSMTEAGASLYAQCTRFMKEVEEAETTLLEQSEVLRGTLRINAPITLTHLYLTEVVVDFMKQHPHLRVELTVTDALIDLFAQNVDVIIRVAKLADSSLIAKKLATDERVVIASPHYLALNGIPNHPKDLLFHQCLSSFMDPKEEWKFQEDKNEYSIPIQGKFVSNNGTVLREAALQGLGLARLPRFMVEQEIKNGFLQTVLQEYQLPSGGIYALFAPQSQVPKKIKLFADFLTSSFQSTFVK